MKKKKQEIIDESHHQLKKGESHEALNNQEWQRKNEELEKILAEKTVELERMQREAKIEVALERVRARVMAMRHSDELSEAAELLYNEFLKLGVESFSCGYLINDDEKAEWKIWLTNPGEKFFKEFWTAPYEADHNLKSRYESWKQQEKFHCAVLEGEENRAHHIVISQYAPWKEDMTASLPPRLVFNSAHFSLGHLLVISPNRLTTELEQAMVRFASVFDLAFLRFLDLQKAEEQLQLNRQLQLEETNRLKELDSFKTKFYTNITHEFRTPLTVILGMADQVNKQPRKAAELIKRNSQSLLTLVNQMLDLSKLESGNLKLELEQKDIIRFLLYVTESFQSLGESKGIRLMAYSEIDELIMDYDEEKLKQVISNILTNAIKFTNENGKVILHITEIGSNSKKLQIKIQDNGIGIPADQLPNIFDRFYQVDDSSIRKGEGTGIGLALTKELVRLMNGEINVTSKLGKGTTFKILLPIQNAAPMGIAKLTPIEKIPTKKEVPPDPLPTMLTANESSGKPTLLLIEDNEDVITYIQSCLDEDYEIKKAINGQIGIDAAFELTPDLIISDVMMPKKDGYEVCAILKTDIRTSHIPIILLTAKTTEEDKIAGLKQGADAYLTKPFNKEELQVRIEKLLALRKQLQKRYSSFSGSFLSKKSGRAETDLDAIFLQKIRKEIEDKISDSDLGIVQLCRAVRLSHTQVYRKMKALTGEHPTGYIRKMRLHKAKEMLQTTELYVSEIAYEIGFTDPNHFSRSFSQEFGNPPSAMRK